MDRLDSGSVDTGLDERMIMGRQIYLEALTSTEEEDI